MSVSTIPDDILKPKPKTSPRPWWQLGLFTVFVPGIALLFLHGLPNNRHVVDEREAASVKKMVGDLKNAHPDYVILGDSMLFTRMEETDLNQMSGKKFAFLSNSGASSATWFLYFKNIVLEAGLRPKAVIIFFRDAQLSMPGFRTEGIYQAYFESLMKKEEPEIAQVLNRERSQESAVGGLRNLLFRSDGWLSFRDPAEKARDLLSGVGMDLTSFGKGKAQRKIEMDRRFALEQLRPDLAGEAQDLNAAAGPGESLSEPAPFDVSPVASFLPHFIRLSREHGIKLVFFRVKRQPNRQNETPQSPEMIAYTRELSDWVQAQGCLWWDETGDPNLTRKLYQDGDHLAAVHRRWYAGYFWQRMQPLLP